MKSSPVAKKPVDATGCPCQSADIGAVPRAESEMNGCQIIKAMLRFEQKLITTEDGHRIWTGAQTKGGPRGGSCYKIKKRCGVKRLKGTRKPMNGSPPYGKFWVGPDKKQTVQAHVFAAFIAGKIGKLRVPCGMHLNHKCHHGTLCVDCTELVTAEANLEQARRGAIGRESVPPPPSKRRKPSRRGKRRTGNPVSSPVAKKACARQRSV